MSSLQIRLAEVSDVQQLAELGRITFLESHGHSASEADIQSYVAEKYTAEIIHADLVSRNSICHVVEVDGRMIGYTKVILQAACQEREGEQLTKLERLYFLSSENGKGYAQQVLDFLVDFSKGNGDWGMWLYVWKENHRALRFYEKSGFSPIGEYSFPISATHSNPNWRMLKRY